MENRELIKKLNSLRSIKPDQEWKERNRRILSSQISSSTTATVAEEKKFASIFILTRKFVKTFSAPAWSILFICLIIVLGSVFSVGAARLSKPDSSLYIARIISEKAQLAITFSEEKKAQLGFKFANNHAKDITDILAKTDMNDEENKIRTEKLTQNFKEEINTAKTKLTKLKTPGVREDGLVLPNEPAEESGDSDVFSANLGREDKGMQISGPINPNQETIKQLDIMAEKDIEAKATNTPTATGVSQPDNLEDAHKVLEEAEELFNIKDYSGASDKLEEANTIVENIKSENKGNVKGASEDGSATTTQEEK